MVQGQIFLKGRGLALFLFNFLGLSFLHLEITLLFANSCYVFEEKKIFFSHHVMKKVIIKCLKINLEISHKIR